MTPVAPSIYSAAFVMNDGGLVSRRLVEEVGLPREDLFIMMEDVEYTLRASRAGLEVCVLAHDGMHRQHLGASGADGHDGVWRDYYQTRNHVRIALESRDLEMIVGCILRQVHLVAAAVRSPDRRRARLRLRMRGIADGVRGRMGRTIEPGGAA